MTAPHLSSFCVRQHGTNRKTRRIIDGFPIYQASMAENIFQAIINATLMMAIVGKEGKKERYREKLENMHMQMVQENEDKT